MIQYKPSISHWHRGRISEDEILLRALQHDRRYASHKLNSYHEGSPMKPRHLVLHRSKSEFDLFQQPLSVQNPICAWTASLLNLS